MKYFGRKFKKVRVISDSEDSDVDIDSQLRPKHQVVVPVPPPPKRTKPGTSSSGVVQLARGSCGESKSSGGLTIASSSFLTQIADGIW